MPPCCVAGLTYFALALPIDAFTALQQPFLANDDRIASTPQVLAELSAWFGAGETAGWRHLRTYRIPFAQPAQSPPTNFLRPVALGGGLFVCGDHRDSATLDGAIKSGRRAAEALLSS